MRILFSLFIHLLMFGSVSGASFSELSLRYLPGHELRVKLAEIYEYQEVLNQKYFQSSKFPSCRYDFSNDVRDAVGENNPIVGMPISGQPGPAYLTFIQSCVRTFFIDLEPPGQGPENKIVLPEATVNFYFSSDLRDKYFRDFNLKKNSISFLVLKAEHLEWKSIPSEDQRAIVKRLIQIFLGSDEVINSYGIAQSAEQIAAKVEATLGSSTLLGALKEIVETLVVREEFLSY